MAWKRILLLLVLVGFVACTDPAAPTEEPQDLEVDPTAQDIEFEYAVEFLGETRASIATERLGDPSYWEIVVPQNAAEEYGADDMLPVGTVVRLPTFEGDMVLEPIQAAALNEEAMEDAGEFTTRAAPVTTVRRWTNNVMPYTLDPSLSTAARQSIARGMNAISQSTCISFQPRTNQRNYVRFFRGSGCYSQIGMTNRGRQDISIGNGCQYDGIVIHEIFHALGFPHEQSRSDRDQHVRIETARIRADRLNNFRKYRLGQTDTSITPYDYSSIMHYGKSSFARVRGQTTITTLDRSKQNVIGQRRAMTQGDIRAVNAFYQCRGSGGGSAPSPTPQPGGNTRSCTATRGYCTTGTCACQAPNSNKRTLQTNTGRICYRCEAPPAPAGAQCTATRGQCTIGTCSCASGIKRRLRTTSGRTCYACRSSRDEGVADGEPVADDGAVADEGMKDMCRCKDIWSVENLYEGAPKGNQQGCLYDASGSTNWCVVTPSEDCIYQKSGSVFWSWCDNLQEGDTAEALNVAEISADTVADPVEEVSGPSFVGCYYDKDSMQDRQETVQGALTWDYSHKRWEGLGFTALGMSADGSGTSIGFTGLHSSLLVIADPADTACHKPCPDDNSKWCGCLDCEVPSWAVYNLAHKPQNIHPPILANSEEERFEVSEASFSLPSFLLLCLLALASIN